MVQPRVDQPEIIEVLSRQDRATRLMAEVSERVGTNNMDEFANLLVKLLNQKNFIEVAQELKVNKATLDYWLKKLGIEVMRVAIRTDRHKILIVPK